MSEHANDACVTNQRFPVYMLVAMKEKSWLSAPDVTDKRVKAKMDLVVSVMNVPR